MLLSAQVRAWKRHPRGSLALAMAAKRTLNARNLESLGAAALAELLIEVSSGNAVIQRRLRLALAAAGGADGAAQEVRKRLAAIARSRPLSRSGAEIALPFTSIRSRQLTR